MEPRESFRRSMVSEVRLARILLCIAFTPAYIVLAPPMPYALLPLLFIAGFIASQFLDLKRLYHPWLSYLSPFFGFLLNASVIFTTGFQRSPFLFFVLVPIVTYGIERPPVWVFRSAMMNTSILAFLSLRALIQTDWFGLAYTLGITMTSHTACRLMRRTQGLSSSYILTMEDAAGKDPLTGLYNRRAFAEYVAELSSRETPFALTMCDLDGFKRYNDRFGHPAGDEVLKKVGALLSESLRSTDAVFRYGGDEFVIIMPDVNEFTVNGVCNRIKKLVSKEIGGVGISFGSAFFPEDGATVQKVIEIADKRLYEAKRMSQPGRTTF
ncbi:MAG: GGDEF domain-containing protein [Firmicutes bacterium]|nr:GGDEF domain-containing protein [Bacillota bacterium]